MRLNNSVYLSSENWFTVAPTVNSAYQTEYPLQVPAYYTSSGTQYGGIYYGGQSGAIPLNTPIDNSICYAGVMADSPLNNWVYALLSDVPSEVNVLQLGFTSDTKNGVAFSHTADTITLNGTLNTSSNTILIFDLKTDATTSTEYPANPFEGRAGTYTISPTGNSNIKIQLYGFNNGGGLQSIYNNSSGGTVTIDNSYDYYVFRLWIAGSASFTNHTFTCKCTLNQQRSVNTFSACEPVDHGIFTAFSPATSFYTTSGDGAAQRWCTYTDDTTARSRGKCQWYSMPYTQYRYNDIIYCIYIVCSATLTGSVSVFDLDTYYRTYRSSYPIIRAFFMRPYVGDPDKGYNRVYYNHSRKYEPSGGSESSTIALTQNRPYTLPQGLALSGAAVSPVSDFYMYGFSATCHYSGTLFGIYSTINMQSHAGDTDFSNCTELYQCNMHRVTDLFQYVVDNYTVRTQYLGDKDSILSVCAHFGVIFTESQYSAETSSITNLTDPKIHVPVISNGYITGEYNSGSEAADMPNVSWTDNFREQNEYDGEPAEPFNMETELIPQNSAAASPFTYQYVLNSTKVSQLKDYLYTTIASSTDETQLFEQFLTNNPIDCIASLVVFPFNVETYTDGVAGEHVIMGNVDTGIVATGLYRGMVIVLDGGSVKYRDYYNDFRSYEPYSDAELHIPYHGNVHISPSEYVGHTISVKYLVDICSGASIALIYRDGLVIDSITGQIGGTLRLTGIQTASYHNAVYNAASGYKQAKTSQAVQGASAILGVLGSVGNAISQKDLGGVLSSITSGIGGAAQAAINTENKEYNLNHIQVPYKSIGANTTFTSMGNEQYCRLIIKRPVMLQYDSESYAHTTGYATIETAKLSEYSGYTKISAADLSGIPCTAQERADILRLLQSGIYL